MKKSDKKKIGVRKLFINKIKPINLGLGVKNGVKESEKKLEKAIEDENNRLDKNKSSNFQDIEEFLDPSSNLNSPVRILSKQASSESHSQVQNLEQDVGVEQNLNNANVDVSGDKTKPYLTTNEAQRAYNSAATFNPDLKNYETMQIRPVMDEGKFMRQAREIVNPGTMAIQQLNRPRIIESPISSWANETNQNAGYETQILSNREDYLKFERKDDDRREPIRRRK